MQEEVYGVSGKIKKYKKRGLQIRVFYMMNTISFRI